MTSNGVVTAPVIAPVVIKWNTLYEQENAVIKSIFDLLTRLAMQRKNIIRDFTQNASKPDIAPMKAASESLSALPTWFKN